MLTYFNKVAFHCLFDTDDDREGERITVVNDNDVFQMIRDVCIH